MAVTKVEITITEHDEGDHKKVLKFSQEDILCAEDFEYVCIRAGLSWGFESVFEDRPLRMDSDV